MIYRRITTGEIISYDDVVNERGKNLLSIGDERNWNVGRWGLERIAETEPPSIDHEFYRLDGVNAVYVDKVTGDAVSFPEIEPDAVELEEGEEPPPPWTPKGHWVQVWTTLERFSSVDLLRNYMIQSTKDLAKSMREGGIKVSNIPIKTTPDALSLLSRADQNDRESFDFVVGDSTFQLSKAQVAGISAAVDDFIQGCYSRESALIQEIKSSGDPKSIDYSAGWPSNEP